MSQKEIDAKTAELAALLDAELDARYGEACDEYDKLVAEFAPKVQALRAKFGGAEALARRALAVTPEGTRHGRVRFIESIGKNIEAVLTNLGPRSR